MTKGYKATYNYKCLNQTYEIGKEYKLDHKPIICESGFHYSKIAKNTLSYYPLTQNFKLLEIEDLNPTDTKTDYDKSCSNHIKIVREIIDENELFQLLGQQYTYDKNGNRLTYKDSTGFSYQYTYDSYGNVLSYDSDNSILSQPKDYDFTLTNNLFYLPYIPLKNQQSFLYP